MKSIEQLLGISTFDPKSIKEFRFTKYEFKEETRTLELSYALDNRYNFKESYTFPAPLVSSWQINRQALDAAAKLLHLAVGVSYFKSCIPEKIVVENQTLSKDTAEFFNKLYLNGLGEFAFRNKLPLVDIVFPYNENINDEAIKCELPDKIAVPVGGGKDSIVTIEALKKAKFDINLFALGNYTPINAVAEKAGLPLSIINRHLDPLLIELNKAGAYNGHVPISAIIALTLVCAGIICGFDTIAISQERSSNEPNVVYNGRNINHQYSKSFEFEKDLQALLGRILPDIHYFSFLRPLSELGICKLFAKKCSSYFESFSSCNKSFKISDPLRGVSWCCDCPKCRFIFLALAAFLPKETVITIFRRNILDNPVQIEGFRELMGLTGHKPFECVGEIKESRAAFLLLSSEWQKDAVVAAIKEEIKDVDWDLNDILEKTDSILPQKFEEALNAF